MLEEEKNNDNSRCIEEEVEDDSVRIEEEFD